MIIEDWPTIKIYKFTVLLSCLVNIVIQVLFIITNLDVTYVVVLSSLFVIFYLITFFAAYYEHFLGTLLGGTGILLIAVFAFLKVPAILEFILFLLMIAIIYGYCYLIWKKDTS